MKTLKSITVALIMAIFTISFIGEMLDVDWSIVPIWELISAGLFIFIPTFWVFQMDDEL